MTWRLYKNYRGSTSNSTMSSYKNAIFLYVNRTSTTNLECVCIMKINEN